MIKIFITGGTFDKEYNYISGKLSFSNTHVNDMLKRGRSALDIHVETIMMKDSQELTLDDRKTILQFCKKEPDDRIVITHGTDTMVQTAEFLASHNLQKTIVLTGAMIPYTFGTSSDGFFNLGSALAFVQVLPPQVYVVMNGRYYDWDKVKKNYTTGFFEYVHESAGE